MIYLSLSAILRKLNTILIVSHEIFQWAGYQIKFIHKSSWVKYPCYTFDSAIMELISIPKSLLVRWCDGYVRYIFKENSLQLTAECRRYANTARRDWWHDYFSWIPYFSHERASWYWLTKVNNFYLMITCQNIIATQNSAELAVLIEIVRQLVTFQSTKPSSFWSISTSKLKTCDWRSWFN